MTHTLEQRMTTQGIYMPQIFPSEYKPHIEMPDTNINHHPEINYQEKTEFPKTHTIYCSDIESKVNLYTSNISGVYCSSSIIQTNTGIIIPQPQIGGINMHDTYKVDRYNNLYGGHTTINLPNNGKIRF